MTVPLNIHAAEQIKCPSGFVGSSAASRGRAMLRRPEAAPFGSPELLSHCFTTLSSTRCQRRSGIGWATVRCGRRGRFGRPTD
jgi:hypothetical protein